MGRAPGAGRSGVADLVERLASRASRFAEGIASIEGAEVLNDVVFTQVCATFGDDATTEEVVRRSLADGTAWTTGSRWRGRSVLRVAVSNWSTTSRTSTAPSTRYAGRSPSRPADPCLARVGACASPGSPPVRTRSTAWSPASSTTRPARRGRRRGRPGRRPPLRRHQAARGGAPARRRPAARAGAAAQQGRRHRPQLRRARRRAGQRPARRAADVPQAQHQRRRPGRRRSIYPQQTSNLHYEGELAVVIGRICRDVPAEQATDVHPRLHDRQRRHRPRPAEQRRAVHPRPRGSTPSARSARGSRPTSTPRLQGRGVACRPTSTATSCRTARPPT